MSSVAGKVIVVTGATGVTGRAVAEALTDAGAIVVAVGTDAARLATVSARERVVADLAEPASVAEAARVAAGAADARPATTAADGESATTAADRAGGAGVDAVIHLVGGWRGGDDAETRAWLDERLVTTLQNVVDAFAETLAAAPSARLAIVGSTAVTEGLLSGEKEPGSAYAAAKLAAERIVADVAERWRGTESAALSWVVRAIGDGEKDTPPSEIAAAALALWDAPAAELNGTRLRL